MIKGRIIKSDRQDYLNLRVDAFAAGESKFFEDGVIYLGQCDNDNNSDEEDVIIVTPEQAPALIEMLQQIVKGAGH